MIEWERHLTEDKILKHNLILTDFQAEREERDAKERQDKKKVLNEQKAKEKLEEKRRQEQADLKNFSSLMKADKMQTNYDDGNDSDDFM